MDKAQIKEKVLEALSKDPHKNYIQKISLFGSFLHGNQNQDSDVDLLIEFAPDAKIGFFKLAQIQRNFNASLEKKVDLLTPDALSIYFRDEVINQAELIYERQ